MAKMARASDIEDDQPKPPGWYLINPEDSMAQYWNGESFTGFTSAAHQNYPLFSGANEDKRRKRIHKRSVKKRDPRAVGILLFVVSGLVSALIFGLVMGSYEKPYYESAAAKFCDEIATLESCVAEIRSEFITGMRFGNSEELELTTDSELLGAGHTVCDQLDEGASFEGVIEGLIEVGITSSLSNDLLYYSVYKLCPEHEKRYDEW